MKLQFPTLAEQAETAFRESKVTVAVEVVAKRFGATKTITHDQGAKFIEFRFPDDTTLVTSGSGIGHKITTHLP